ncbi:hypothetical protein AMAG_10579 [Allomyces macrogynus ATCC 38327]|uniref:Uncharacterized protein n=1 Tax=Allomyces macrogynus (strain ATCC 38327) TaxID=578462 RepID=A0A0L0SQY4_ALLM3|nr:hypothetical protein AMAG_10579 [Allomyces macrogynus ATCC 38327]|eukprot:KNE64911.1 hypothetical protein AMAG_10579 [Allomyces macrogynus ATCC 38327]
MADSTSRSLPSAQLILLGPPQDGKTQLIQFLAINTDNFLSVDAPLVVGDGVKPLSKTDGIALPLEEWVADISARNAHDAEAQMRELVVLEEGSDSFSPADLPAPAVGHDRSLGIALEIIDTVGIGETAHTDPLRDVTLDQFAVL